MAAYFDSIPVHAVTALTPYRLGQDGEYGSRTDYATEDAYWHRITYPSSPRYWRRVYGRLFRHAVLFHELVEGVGGAKTAQ
ncbi:MAG TPA: hypothetical protein VEB88_03935 [Candidatus Acidoferrales bacterium]|nr:hypothetical protein [Candidatus Acidoferrales bacterium]